MLECVISFNQGACCLSIMHEKPELASTPSCVHRGMSARVYIRHSRIFFFPPSHASGDHNKKKTGQESALFYERNGSVPSNQLSALPFPSSPAGQFTERRTHTGYSDSVVHLSVHKTAGSWPAQTKTDH